MDPVTAIGIAGAVVQFVSFAHKLVSETREVYTSASNQSKHVATLDEIYTSLLRLSSQLRTASTVRPNDLDSDGVVKHVLAIRALSQNCERDCAKLLEIAQKLRGKGEAGGKLQSFRVALKTFWKSSEIDELEGRLQRTQTTLTLHICALTTHWHGVFDRHLRELRRENLALEARQSLKLDSIARTLRELDARITAAHSAEQSSPFAPDDMAHLEGQMSKLSLFKAAAAKEQQILRSLSFESRPVRHSSIPSAHIKTFEWVFRSHDSNGNGDPSTTRGDLLKWLAEGNGTFWVSGKPGSGKSTFMKFLADHPKTAAALNTWSSPGRLVVASHFFWSAGTPMQKSWQGLLQTLLYDIFRQLPDLIETACADRWPKAVEELSYEPWLLPELQRALQRIASQDMEVKFCLFIDGLDEFEGDQLDFCRSLLQLATSPHVKLCVSSRAWNVFEDSFGREPETKIYIHELTHNDIRSYAERRLQDHPRWKDLEAEEANAAWLMDEITERAAGVFLWVYLVTSQLRNGLTEYDSFSDLKKRLERIPVDLEAFFKQILESVEPFYHEKMATTLLISLAALEPAPIAVYGFHDDEYEDENYALNIPAQSLPKAQISAKREQMTRRINARCRGLLEVAKRSYRIEFLHRSVMEFLKTNEMADFLSRKATPNFNPHLSLMRAYTAYIKTTKFSKVVDRTAFAQNTPTPLTSALREVLAHAKLLAGSKHETASHRLLDEIDARIPEMQRKGQVTINVWNEPSSPAVAIFRDFVLESCLAGYLRRVLTSQPDYFAHIRVPILAFVVAIMIGRCCGGDLTFDECAVLIHCLLECGCDPNASYTSTVSAALAPPERERTPWRDLVAWPVQNGGNLMCRCDDDEPDKIDWGLRRAKLREVMMLMLKHGADTNLWPGKGVDEVSAIESRLSVMIGSAVKRERDSLETASKSAKRQRSR